MRTTDRLYLRPFRDEDLPAWADLNTDPEVMRYLGGKPLTRAETDEIASAVNSRYEADGTGFLAIERRSDGAFLGAAGLTHESWHPDDLDLGWRLARQYWGHGYATEAAASWLTCAFTDLDLPRVLSSTETANTKSAAVMQRLGMTFDHEALLEEASETFAAVIYSITQQTWKS
ncbi:GNAT family N-acetyltransferase [Streptomyces sp. SID13031]|uniref:GNAT family N-acetyltransferase n=1 Tax=Streptomyces sp. SID13031 TaxID=2706046 RepID=UPI0013CCC2A4|nr:GNAT family N-acetyltransferase [Streptomyces sp. SID13031]NEA32723.1 GNAT family N-acetyltransferase [Streptomyces sp. SID13031]